MDSAPIPNVAFAGSACLNCFKVDQTFIITPSTTTTHGEVGNGQGQDGMSEKKEKVELKKCSSCRIAKYCSTECIQRDWKDHKSFCRSMKAIRSTLDPPKPFYPSSSSSYSSSTSTSSKSNTNEDKEEISRRNKQKKIQEELILRHSIQRKAWLTETELLSVALKRQPTPTETRLLYNESRCMVCWDRECDVERRIKSKLNEDQDGWRTCRDCKVVGWCGSVHEEESKKRHRQVKDSDGRSQCETVQFSNEIDEYFLRHYLTSPDGSPPKLWVPNRTLSTTTKLPSSWLSWLKFVSQYLSQRPSNQQPPLAEVFGVYFEHLSPVFTILNALERFESTFNNLEDFGSDHRLTVYLLDETVQTTSKWVPCLEELQHRLPRLRHLELITVAPLSSSPPGSNDRKTNKLPMCEACVKEARTRTIRHIDELPNDPSPTASNSKLSPALAVSFESSLAMVYPDEGEGENKEEEEGEMWSMTKWWKKNLDILVNRSTIPVVFTSTGQQGAIDAMLNFHRLVSPPKNNDSKESSNSLSPSVVGFNPERNVWKGGWPKVEGWWPLVDDNDHEISDERRSELAEGEGIVWSNGWWMGLQSSPSA